MTIEVYGKKGCGKCEAAKDKLRRMGIDFREFDLAQFITPHAEWRTDGSVDLMAAHTLLDTLPLLKVGDEITDYKGAMRLLKAQAAEEASVA